MPRWYYSTNGKAEGPVETPFLIENLKAGRFTLVDLVFQEGDSAWKTFGEIPEFRDAYQAPPVPVLHPLLTTPSRGQSPADAEVSKNALPKPESGWPSDWRLSSSWIVLRKRIDSNGYEQDGPFSAEQIIEMIGSGKIEYSQYCWKPGYTRWFRIGNLPEFDRRKRDRENDPVNQIVPIPEIAEELPALTREELLANVERLRRQETPAQEDLGKNLVEDEITFDSAPVKKNDSAAKVKAKPAATSPVVAKTAPSLPASAPAKPTPVKAASAAASGAVETVKPAAVVAPTPTPAVVTAKVNVKPQPVAQAKPAIVTPAATSPTPEAPTPAPIAQPAVVAAVGSPTHETSKVAVHPPKATPPNGALPKPLRIGFAALFSAIVVFGMIHIITRRHPGRSSLASAATALAPKVARSSKRQPSAVPPAAAAPTKAPAPPPAAPAKNASVLEIVPLKLETSGPSLAFQTNVAPGEPIKVTLKAKSGEILKYASFAKSVDISRAGGELPTLDLTKFSLPSGTYTVDAVSGNAVTSKQIFIGQRDAAFVSALERHLKSISYRQQLERSTIYYGAVKLTAGAKSLIEQSHDLKGQAAKWKSVYETWRATAREAIAPVLALTKAPANETAYPDQLKAFNDLADQLLAETAQVNEAMGQKRDIATAQPLEAVVSALDQLKLESAHLSGRPQAANDQ